MSFEKLVDIPNSVSVLPELLPHSLELARKRVTGVLNFTNPGTVSHNEIMEMVRDYIDPAKRWENFSEDDCAKILKAPRSNCELDTSILLRHCPTILPARESILSHVFEPHKHQLSAQDLKH